MYPSHAMKIVQPWVHFIYLKSLCMVLMAKVQTAEYLVLMLASTNLTSMYDCK